MKDKIKYLFLIAMFASCTKQYPNEVHCYKCQTQINSSEYTDIGCMTNEQYKSIDIVNGLGNSVKKTCVKYK